MPRRDGVGRSTAGDDSRAPAVAAAYHFRPVESVGMTTSTAGYPNPSYDSMSGDDEQQRPRTVTSSGGESSLPNGGAGALLAPGTFADPLDCVSGETRETGDRLRRHLQFFFMDPMQKWRVRRQFPYKLVLQLFKIVFITWQLILFAELRMSHVDFLEDTTLVMRHRFLQDWDDQRDVFAYPPSTGTYAIYTFDEFVNRLAHIVVNYYDISDTAFGAFSYDLSSREPYERSKTPGWPFSWDEPGNDEVGDKKEHIPFDKIPPIETCFDRIAGVEIRNNTYEFDVTDVHDCHFWHFNESQVDEIRQDPMKLKAYLKAKNMTFSDVTALSLSALVVRLRLRTIHFADVTDDERPECYRILVTITFDNSRHTGQVPVSLSSLIEFSTVCNGRVIKGSTFDWDTLIMAVIDLVVLVLCIASFGLCCRALIKAYMLCQKTGDFFRDYLRVDLTFYDKLDFCNLWYVMIILNDVAIVTGTLCKVSIEFRDFDSNLFTLTGVMLGIGALLVYVGVLRYCGFFSQYNILILTLKRSLPAIGRFMVCAIVLYFGFLITGWVIIGPYSMKFRTLSSSSEALFSLINGDDMYATFSTVSDSNSTIKIFSTAYVYIFVSLFIYVVLSLFIAIILDAYEVVKDRYAAMRALGGGQAPAGLALIGIAGERSVLRDFVASAPPPSTDADVARHQYAPQSLLNLGSGIRHRFNASTARLRSLLAGHTFPDFSFSSFSNPINDAVSLEARHPAGSAADRPS